MASDRVTLRADDALFAFTALRFDIEANDETLARNTPAWDYYGELVKSREERWQAYQRIAKALGLKPTLKNEVKS